jgi:hypothetical protein
VLKHLKKHQKTGINVFNINKTGLTLLHKEERDNRKYTKNMSRHLQNRDNAGIEAHTCNLSYILGEGGEDYTCRPS